MKNNCLSKLKDEINDNNSNIDRLRQKNEILNILIDGIKNNKIEVFSSDEDWIFTDKI